MINILLNYFKDPGIEEIFLNGTHQLTLVMSNGDRQHLPTPKITEQALIARIQEFSWQQGIRMDPLRPAGGGIIKSHGDFLYRWHSVLPPASPSGPLLSLRKLLFNSIPLEAFHQDPNLMAQLKELVSYDLVFFAGETGAGKTTLLTSLASALLYTQRVFIIETISEINQVSPHWVQLLTRGADIEGRGLLNCDDLVRECLRLRPDRFIFGEIRSHEARTLHHLASTASAGVWTTIHTANPEHLIPRLSILGNLQAKTWNDLFTNLRVAYVQLQRKSPRLTGIFRYHHDQFVVFS